MTKHPNLIKYKIQIKIYLLANW